MTRDHDKQFFAHRLFCECAFEEFLPVPRVPHDVVEEHVDACCRREQDAVAEDC